MISIMIQEQIACIKKRDIKGIESVMTQPSVVCSMQAIHYNDVIMSAMASQITSLTIVYSIVYSGADQRKHQSSASLAFVCGIHRWPVNSPHNGPVTQKMIPFDDVIMYSRVFWMNDVIFCISEIMSCCLLDNVKATSVGKESTPVFDKNKTLFETWTLGK